MGIIITTYMRVVRFNIDKKPLKSLIRYHLHFLGRRRTQAAIIKFSHFTSDSQPKQS